MDLSSYVEAAKGNKVVRLDNVRRAADKFGLSIKETELLFLDRGIVPCRYTGNVRTIGISGQAKLLQSTVCIIGCGGLGGSVIELCARLGIGKIILADGDRFDESNLNRQLLSEERFMDLYKTECGVNRIKSINSGLEVVAHNLFLKGDNATEIINGSDCVIDALDNVESRLILQKACKKLSIPLIHGAIGDSLIHITTVMPGDDTLNNIYSNKGIKSDAQRPGNPAISPFLCAAIEVSEVLKILLGKGDQLRNRLLHFDWMYNDFNIFNI